MIRRNPSVLMRSRLVVIVVVLSAAAVGLVARAANLQVTDAAFLKAQGDARNQRIEPLAATRGLILDRNGQPLAVSTPVKSVWGNPQQLLQEKSRWKELARVAGVDYVDMADRILHAQSREFVYIRRHLAPEAAEAILALKIPSLQGMTEYRRYYPAGEVAAHVVGFTNVDDRGQEGMERAWEDNLGARTGKRKVIKDLNGRVVDDVEIIEDPRSGKDLTLSIDLRIQYLAYRELVSAVQQNHADGGSVVVMDVSTGEVLAMVNQPSYNPNARGDDIAARRNRAVTDMFEPGSTMKTFTVAAALESGKFRPETLIDTAPGKLKIGDKVISDHEDFGTIDVTTVLTKSSNIGSTKMALAMGPQQLVSMLRRVGLGAPTKTGFPGESGGTLRDRPHWYPIEVATLSYGYGISVTALQLAQSYAVIAAGGVFRPATLLRQENRVVPGQRVIDEKLAHTLVHMLETVTTDAGTAAKARINGYTVAGKTGTAHKNEKGGYESSNYVAVFAGIAPAKNPRVVTVTVIDNPQNGTYYGGLVAAPVFSAVTAGALRTLNVSPDDVEPGDAASETSIAKVLPTTSGGVL